MHPAFAPPSIASAPSTLEAVSSVYAGAYDLLERDRPREAADLLRALVVLVPHDERGWLGLVHAHELLGETEVAEKLARLAQPVTGSARCVLAEARLVRARGDVPGARELAERARQLAEAAGDDDLAALAEGEVAS